MHCIVSKTGYTGSAGYELYLDAKDAANMWELLLETGKDEGLICCGLGARDTLRLEAGMPLYGHEMDETVTPLESGLGFCVKFSKEEFIGKEALESSEPTRIRVAENHRTRHCKRTHASLLRRYPGGHGLLPAPTHLTLDILLPWHW